MADQHSSDRNNYDVISKEEAKENLVEATNAFLNFVSQRAMRWKISI